MKALERLGKGIAIGIADLIPGVSGATIALIVGAYEKLIEEISGLLRFELRRDWLFLLPIGLGAGLAVLLGSFLIPGLVERYPVAVFGLFSGLIGASAFLLARHLHGPRRAHAWLILGSLIGAGIAMLPVGLQAPITVVGTIIAGALAIGAMLLPGISGSYVLLLLGYYTHVFGAIRSFDLGFLFLFALGGLIGGATSVLAINRLLHRWHLQGMLLLIGIIVGALGRPLGIAMSAASGPTGWFTLGIFAAAGVLVTVLLARHA